MSKTSISLYLSKERRKVLGKIISNFKEEQLENSTEKHHFEQLRHHIVGDYESEF